MSRRRSALTAFVLAEALCGSASRCTGYIILYIDSLGETIRDRRLRTGLSQRSLALRAGTTQAAVSRIERGLTTPTWETVRALLLALGFEPELRARRLRGRWDPVHLDALRRRSPEERLQLALSANRMAGALRRAGREAGALRRAGREADDGLHRVA
jgi:transcriptional regulator with XRE-family HTH domain